MTAPLEITVALDPKVIGEYVAQVMRDELAAHHEAELPRLAYSIAEAAHAVAISPATAYRMVKAGELPYIELRGRKVVPVVMLEEWMAVQVARATRKVRAA